MGKVFSLVQPHTKRLKSDLSPEGERNYLLKSAFDEAQGDKIPIEIPAGKYCPAPCSPPSNTAYWVEAGSLTYFQTTGDSLRLKQTAQMSAAGFKNGGSGVYRNYLASQIITLKTGMILSVKTHHTVGNFEGGLRIIHPTNFAASSDLFTSLGLGFWTYNSIAVNGVLANYGTVDVDYSHQIEYAMVVDLERGRIYQFHNGNLMVIILGWTRTSVRVALGGSRADIYTFVDEIKVSNFTRPELLATHFYQEFSNADGSGATGGTTEDPTLPGKPWVDISGGKQVGLANTPGLTPYDQSGLTHTLTTPLPIMEGAHILCQFSSLSLPAIGLMQSVVVYGSDNKFVCRVGIARTGANALSLKIQDNDGNDLAVVYSGTIAEFVFPMIIQINIWNTLASIVVDGWKCSMESGISDGGAMTATDIGKIKTIFQNDLGTAQNFSGCSFDNLEVYRRYRGKLS